MQKSKLFVFSVLILTLVAFFGYGSQNPVLASNSNEKIIRVTGEAVLTAAPDQGTIILAVETRNVNARTAVEENAKLTSAVISALKNMGLNDEQIKTGTYNLYSYNEYIPEKAREEQQVQYRATNTLQITISDLDKVGNVIDAAIKAGANRVQSVQFELKDAEAVKLEALQKATIQARAKAEAMAKGAGVSITGIKTISEDSYGYTPYRASYQRDMIMADAAESAPSTPIVTGDVEVYARVIVEYTF